MNSLMPHAPSLPVEILFDKPSRLKVEVEKFGKKGINVSIHHLINSIKKNGPRIAYASLGPEFYLGSPEQFSLNGKTIYKWPPLSEVCTKKYSACILILGATKSDKEEVVYFTHAVDTTDNTGQLKRTYEPSLTDQRIYATTYSTFVKRVQGIFPPFKPSSLYLKVITMS